MAATGWQHGDTKKQRNKETITTGTTAVLKSTAVVY